VVEVTALEMRHTRKGIVGSNPTLSAIPIPANTVRGGRLPVTGVATHNKRVGSNPTLSTNSFVH
jgi:hypothetical protein